MPTDPDTRRDLFEPVRPSGRFNRARVRVSSRRQLRDRLASEAREALEAEGQIPLALLNDHQPERRVGDSKTNGR